MTNTAAIAAAIAETRPHEQLAGELAEQLAAAAAADRIPTAAVLAWIHDYPRWPLSVERWRGWCRRYAIVSAEATKCSR